MTTAYRETPVSQFVKVVDTSRAVKRDSRFDTALDHGPVFSSRIATDDSTDALDGLRDFDAEPFAVTLNGRTVMVAPVPPSIPAQIIPASWVCPWADAAKSINPEGYLQ